MKIYYENAAQGYFGDVKINKESVSIGVFEQVKWERDVAIQQLKELGYCLGEKIRTDEDCISREAVLDKAVYTETEEGWSGRTVDVKVIEALPPVKPKVDVDALINKIETELSWSMYDDWGNATDLHDGLVGIIREWAGRSGEG